MVSVDHAIRYPIGLRVFVFCTGNFRPDALVYGKTSVGLMLGMGKRMVSRTGPYMHNGRFGSLDDVLSFTKSKWIETQTRCWLMLNRRLAAHGMMPVHFSNPLVTANTTD
jgi:hypothetical protein